MRTYSLIALVLPIATLLSVGNVTQEKPGNERNGGEDLIKALGDTIQISESKPVKLNDAQFTVIAQTNWKPTKNNSSPVWPVEIQLRIANLSKGDLVFPTFDSFGVIMTDKDGKKIIPRGGRNITKLTRPILLSSGSSCALFRRAELHWNEKSSTAELFYYDGTGSESYFGPLNRGQYKIGFYYGVSPKQPFGVRSAQPMWIGSIATEYVEIRLADRSAK